MTETTPQARTWTAQHYVAYGDEDAPDNTPEQREAMARARLREQIRGEGFVMDGATFVAAPGYPIKVVEHLNGYDLLRVEGGGDGMLYEFTAGATERGTDTGDLLGDTDDEGLVWFGVPAAIREHGGDVRLRHNLGGEVTVYAYANTERAEKMGYLIAAALDDDVVSVSLLPGTASLSVERDPDADDYEGADDDEAMLDVAPGRPVEDVALPDAGAAPLEPGRPPRA